MLNLNLSSKTTYLASIHIYTAGNRKYQNESPVACTVFTALYNELNPKYGGNGPFDYINYSCF